MASYQSPLDIVIIGGSLGGLTAAITLKSLPNVASITVLERLNREGLQDLGAGIRLGDEIVATIREYTGTPPEKYALRLEMIRFLDEQGEEKMARPIQMWSTTWTQMHRTLKRSLDEDSKCTYRMECEVDGVKETDTKTMSVSFSTPAGATETIHAGLVIAADGPSSMIRRLMQPDARRRSAGYVLYRGLLKPEECSEQVRKLGQGAGVFSFIPSSQVLTYEVPGTGGPADEAPSMINWVWYLNKTDKEIATLLTDKSGKRHQFSLPPRGMEVGEIEKLRETARQSLPAKYFGEILSKTKEPFVQVVTDSAGGDTSFFDGKLLIIGDAVGGQR
jgi:2-polyprenyl-6-methoxyphenol hydroxylase-like FAD-dependent oxidoreductase